MRVICGTYALTSTRRKLLSAPAMHSTSGSFLTVRKGNQSSSNTRVPGNWGCKSELAKGSGESCKKHVEIYDQTITRDVLSISKRENLFSTFSFSAPNS